MATSSMGTRDKLLSILDDIELIMKEILENAISIRHQRPIGAETLSLTKLLIAKEKELKEVLKVAEEQAKIEEEINKLKNDVQRQDQYIQQFERQIKESQQTLATAIFQAHQKLESIDKANARPVSSEELIRYAHRISSSEAICAPLNWQPGDPRRPYPTDLDMRLGLLSRYNDPPINGHVPPTGNLSDIHRGIQGTSGAAEPPVSITNQFAWHPSGEMHMSVPGQSSVSIDTRNHKDNEDVEVMSTDSSSSSSSDSQ